MHRIYYLCLFLLLIAEAGRAQVKQGNRWEQRKPLGWRNQVKGNYWRADVDTGKLYIRMNPAGLIDVLDHNINIGFEYRLNKTWSATMDAGYIFFSQYAGKVKRASGVLLRPGIRKYTGRRKDYYFDLQFHFKEADYTVEDWVDKSIVNDVATYEEYKRFRYRKWVFGAHFMIGGREYLSKNHKWFFEVYAGLGIQFKKEGMPDETNTRYAPENTLRTLDEPSGYKNRILPAVPFGIRLVHHLR